MAATPAHSLPKASSSNWAKLPLAERIAQLLLPLARKANVQTGDSGFAPAEGGTGGYFQGTLPWGELRAMAAAFPAHPQFGLPLIAGDYECRVAIEGGTSLGAAMNLGALADPGERVRLAYETGKSCALQGRAVGTRWTFAPVVDFNANGDNPITNVRAFSDDPVRVAELACAFIRGAQDHGMAATAKHFPGDGFDWRDQHVITAVNPLPESDWRATCGRAFGAAIKSGVHAVMMGHLALPWLDDRDPVTGEHLPATLSVAAHRLLREELGFEGVIVSDAIGMGGMMWHCRTPLDAVVGNLRAGSDVVLFPEDIKGAITAVLAAVARGELSEERINASVARVLELKRKLGLLDPETHPLLPGEDEARALFARLDTSVATDLGRRSLTLVRDRRHDYPLKPGTRIALVYLPLETPRPGGLVVAGQESGASPWRPLEEALRPRCARLHVLHDTAEWAGLAPGVDAVIYVFAARPQAGRSSIRLSYPALQRIEQTRWPQEGIRRFFVCFGNPYVLDELPHLPNFACGYSDVATVQTAYAEALMGEIPFVGRLPVTLREPSEPAGPVVSQSRVERIVEPAVSFTFAG